MCVRRAKNSSVWAFKGFSWLDLASNSQLVTHQIATRVKHARSWRVTTAGALQDKKYSLTWQLTRNSSQSREWVARMPCFAKKWFFTFIMYPTIYTLILTKCRELPKGILRENPKENQDWLIHNLRLLILRIPLLSPFPLTYPWEVH